MGTDYSRKCERIDKRRKRAAELVDMLDKGKLDAVLTDICAMGRHRGLPPTKGRLLAAMVCVILDEKAFSHVTRSHMLLKLCEPIYRERS